MKTSVTGMRQVSLAVTAVFLLVLSACGNNNDVLQEPTPVSANLNVSSVSAVAPATITFSAEGSSGEGELAYSWDFGIHGETASGTEVRYEYKRAGTYTVTLTVSDETGAAAEATQTVVIQPPLQAVIEHSSISDFAPVTVTFDATGSSGIAPLSYAWDFGDDTASSTEAEPSHEYGEAGTYTVILTVTDANGATAKAETELVIHAATPVNPIITADTSSGTAPLTVNFSALNSSGEGELGYLWEFGLEAAFTSREAEPRFTFTDHGTYTVTLTVTDETGASETATQLISVSSAAPTVTFRWPSTDNFGELDVSIHSSPEGTLVGSWNSSRREPVRIDAPGDYYAALKPQPVTTTWANHTYTAEFDTARHYFTISEAATGLITIMIPEALIQPTDARFTLTSNYSSELGGGIVSSVERYRNGSWHPVPGSSGPPGIYRFTPRTITISHDGWTEVMSAERDHYIQPLNSGETTDIHIGYEVEPSLGVNIAEVASYPGANYRFTLTDADGNEYTQDDENVPPGKYSIELHPLDYIDPNGLTIKGEPHPTRTRVYPELDNSRGPSAPTIHLSSNELHTLNIEGFLSVKPHIILSVIAPEDAADFAADVRLHRTLNDRLDFHTTESVTEQQISADFGEVCIEALDTSDYVVSNVTHPGAHGNCFIFDTHPHYEDGKHLLHLEISYEHRPAIHARVSFPDHPSGEAPTGSPISFRLNASADNGMKNILNFVQVNNDKPQQLGGVNPGTGTTSLIRTYSIAEEHFSAGDQIRTIVTVNTQGDESATFTSPPLQIIP